MKTQEINGLEKEIQRIKKELLVIGDMRSGSLTRQYKDPKNKKRGYWSLSYTHKMRGRTESIRPEYLRETGRQIAQYKKFKKLTTRWIDLAREICLLKMKEKKENQNPVKSSPL